VRVNFVLCLGARPEPRPPSRSFRTWAFRVADAAGAAADAISQCLVGRSWKILEKFQGIQISRTSSTHFVYLAN
jgi:hypothetical protein